MDSVLQRLAIRGVVRCSEQSLESDIVDAADYCDAQLNCLSELSLSSCVEADGIVDVIEGQDGLDNIMQQFADNHANTDVTEASAQQLAVSVESYLRAAGINVGIRKWTPSFESADQYSAELKDTRRTVAAGIGKWLVDALRKVMDMIKQWWGQLTGSVTAVRTYVDKVSAKVKSLKGEATNTDPVKLGASANYLTDRHGAIAKPDKQLAESDSLFSDFLQEWYGLFDKETHILKNLPPLKSIKIDFAVGQALEVKPGTGAGNLTGAKVNVVKTLKAAKSEGPLLSLTDMGHGISAAKDALTSFTKLDQEINRLDALSKSSAKEASAQADHYTDSEAGRAFSKRSRDLVKAFQLCSNGLTHVSPFYLKTIRACVEYVAICTRRYATSAQDKTPS